MWKWRGKATISQSTIEIAGFVPPLGTQGMLKRAIVSQAKEKIAAYLDVQKPPVSRVLEPDNIFKVSL